MPARVASSSGLQQGSSTFRRSRLATEQWKRSIGSELWSARVPYQDTHIFIANALGARLKDLDGNEYIDFCNGFGSVFLGHAHPKIKEALIDAIEGDVHALTCPQEATALLAARIRRDLPEKYSVNFFTTGTEAVRAAVDIARRVTGRRLVLSAGYHGWDASWQSATGLVRPNSFGVVDFLYVLEVAERTLARHPRSVAAIVVAPHPYLLSAQWYKRLADLVVKYKVLLISDEVKQGYRHNPGPSVARFGIQADLYTFSKVLANGHRIAAVCGPETYMRFGRKLVHTSYLDAFHATAALATLNAYDEEDAAVAVRVKGDGFLSRLRVALMNYELPIEIEGNGVLFHLIFHDNELEEAFYAECVRAGMIFTYRGAQTPSLALNDDVADEALAKMETALKQLSAHFKNLLRQPMSLTRKLAAQAAELSGVPEAAHATFVRRL